MKPPKGVPKDEWLLAIGLARYEPVGFDWARATACSEAIAGGIGFDRPDWSAAYNGAGSVLGTWANRSNDSSGRRNPDAYAAGAALAMALEVES